jgi:hypothetical protein
MAQLNKEILKLGKYEQYHIIAHAYKKVENANLNGLYQALTLYTCVLDNFVRIKNIKDATRQINPKK